FAGAGLEAEDLLTAGGVRYLHHAVGAALHEASAVGTEGHAADRIRVPRKGQDFPAADRIPQPDQTVSGADRQGTAVRAEGHARTLVAGYPEGQGFLGGGGGP